MSKQKKGVRLEGVSKIYQDPKTKKEFKAVDSVNEEEGLFHFHEHPNPDCPVGRNIHKVLDLRLLDAQGAMEAQLKATTLAEIVEDTKRAVKNES